MSSTSTPCAVCKYRSRKCTPECIFAPYFPANNPERFECVRRLYSASKVGKFLVERPPSQREDMVKALAFEWKARYHNPVYGCTLEIMILKHLIDQNSALLEKIKIELNAYRNPQAIQGPFNPPQEMPPAQELELLQQPPQQQALQQLQLQPDPGEQELLQPHERELLQAMMESDPGEQELLQPHEVEFLHAQELELLKAIMEPVVSYDGLMQQMQVLLQQQKHQIEQL
ncbi:hypothetical protein S83_000017 [Arachis hypogaea]